MSVKRFRCVLFIVPALLIAMLVIAGEPARTDQPEQAAETAQAPEQAAAPQTEQAQPETQQPVGTSFSVIYIDPKTGYMGIQPPGMVIEIPGLEEYISTSGEDLEVFDLEDGGVGIDLKGRFQNLEVAVINGNGEVEIHGVDGSALRQDPAAGEQPAEGRQ